MNRKIFGIILCMLLIALPILTTASSEPKGAALDIEIFGGLKCGAKIRNVGDTDALFLGYNLTISGGFLKPINSTITGFLGNLPPHNGAVDLVITFPSDQIAGFGKVTITAQADSLNTSPIERQADAIVFFFFVILLS